MASYTTRVEFERALRSAKANMKAIRTTLADRSQEAWVLPAFEDALTAADEDSFDVLVVVGRPSLSRKRVQIVCGLPLTDPRRRFYGMAPMAEPIASRRSVPPTPAARGLRQRPPQPVKDVTPSVVVRKAAPRAVPLRDAASVVAGALAREAEKKAAAKAKSGKPGKKAGPDPYLDGLVTCRECLGSYKRRQLPNPRTRVCEDCGGQPPVEERAHGVRRVPGTRSPTLRSTTSVEEGPGSSVDGCCCDTQGLLGSPAVVGRKCPTADMRRSAVPSAPVA